MEANYIVASQRKPILCTLPIDCRPEKIRCQSRINVTLIRILRFALLKMDSIDRSLESLPQTVAAIEAKHKESQDRPQLRPFARRRDFWLSGQEHTFERRAYATLIANIKHPKFKYVKPVPFAWACILKSYIIFAMQNMGCLNAHVSGHEKQDICK